MAAQTDIGKISPLAGLTSYNYTLEVKATGAEARLTLEDYEYLGVSQSDKLALNVKGVVAGAARSQP